MNCARGPQEVSVMGISAAVPAPDVLVNSFRSFEEVAAPVLHIRDESAYESALQTLQELMESAPADPDAMEHDLIELLARAVERYESMLPEVQAWEHRIESLPADVSMLRLLMDQHGLTGSDFKEEIGGKSYVSQILSGDRQLTRKHIEKLSVRFGISPALFFD